MRFPFYLLVALALLAGGTATWADEVMPAKPEHYFNDYAHVASASTASSLDGELENFERQTSNQIVVAVYPKLQTDDSLDNYCYRIFQAWGVGQKKNNNGAVLFVFAQDHKTRIQTGYGLEGALPDVTCQQILDNEIKPHFRQGDYDGGFTAAVHAMMAATKGEYKGNGHTVGDSSVNSGSNVNGGSWLPVIFIILWLLLIIFSRRSRGVMFGSSGIGYYGGFGGGGGGGFSGGGGGGGGFSGGGGSSGGGGASGGW